MDQITARKQLNGMTKVDMGEYFDDVEVVSLYSWIDRIPLSRPKKNIAKDFSDGVLLAEVVKHYFPKMVELHNFSPSHSTRHKLENWSLLNRRVLKALDLELSEDVMRALADGKPKVIERVLMLLRHQIDKMLEKTGRDALWRRRELYYSQPNPEFLRLQLKSPPSPRPHTPPGLKSPRNGDFSQRSSSPARLTKSEPTASSPRKYKKGEIPHSHPDRTLTQLSRNHLHLYIDPHPFSEQRRDTKTEVMLAPRTRLDNMAARSFMSPDKRGSYFADKPLPIVPKPFLPPVSDNIPRVLYEEKEMECHAKEETIQILQAKIRRLEHLLHLKDVRIEDLHTTLQQAVGLNYSVRKR